MLSGSVFGSPVTLRRRHAALHIEIIGRPPPDPALFAAGVTYHGKLRDSLSLLRQANLLVINGGFSAVSEALVLRKPMVVIPVPRHAEQWMNGRTIRHLGVGLIGSEDGPGRGMLEASIESTVARRLRRLAERRSDGAAQAAADPWTWRREAAS